MIVKVRRPPSPQDAQWLIIDRPGGLQRRVSEKALPASVRAAMDGDAKGYFSGHPGWR